MAALRRAAKLKPFLTAVNTINRPISTCPVLRAEWNYNWVPEPVFPQTQEERVAAAKKYMIPVEDYKPYIDHTGHSYGDYPALPYVGDAAKDPWHDWDDPANMRDFHEPVHPMYECLLGNRPDPSKDWGISSTRMWVSFLLTTVLFCGLMFATMPYGEIHSKYDHWSPYDNEGSYLMNGPDRRFKPYSTELPSYKRNIHYTFETVE